MINGLNQAFIDKVIALVQYWIYCAKSTVFSLFGLARVNDVQLFTGIIVIILGCLAIAGIVYLVKFRGK